MDFLEKLNYLMETKGLNKHTLSALCGVPYTTIDSFYKKGYANAKLSTIIKIADYFDTSIDYLMRDEIIDIHYNNNIDTSSIDDNFSKNYFRLDAHGKKVVDSVLNIEIERLNKINDKKITKALKSIQPKYYINKYDIPAGAGIGQYLDDSSYEVLELDYSPPDGAAFVVEVRGDSMEPKYFDGNLVFVKPQPIIEIGEIGIFYHNGESFIKQLGKNTLISLNTKYKPIKLNEYTHCFGKVVGILN